MKDHDLYSTSLLSLVQVINLYAKFSEENKLKEMLIDNGGYLDTLANLFTENQSASKPKLWGYSCHAIDCLATQQMYVDPEKFTDIIGAIGDQLLSASDSISSIHSLDALFSIINLTDQKSEIEERIHFVKKKINVIVDVVIDILEM